MSKHVDELFSLGELSDMLPGSAYYEIDPTLEVMFASNKEPQSLQDPSIMDPSIPPLQTILPSTVANINYPQEKSMPFNLTNQDISCAPTLCVPKEKEVSKRPHSASSTTKAASKRKKNCQTKSENNAQPSFRQNRNAKPQPAHFPFGTGDHSSLPIAPAGSLPSFCPLAPSPSVAPLASAGPSAPGVSPAATAPGTLPQPCILPNTLANTLQQWNPQPGAAGAPAPLPARSGKLPLQKLQKAPANAMCKPPPPSFDLNMMKLNGQYRREGPPSPAFSSPHDDSRGFPPGRGSFSSREEFGFVNGEIQFNSGNGNFQSVEGLARRASDSALYYKPSDSVELSGYYPLPKSESMLGSTRMKAGRLQQRDSQILVHIVGKTEPFGVIAVDRGSARIDSARKMIEKHFGDVILNRAFVFLSHDGVVIRRSQEKELLVWNQTYEKV